MIKVIIGQPDVWNCIIVRKMSEYWMITNCEPCRSCSRRLNLSARRAREREIDARSLKIDNSAARRPRYGKARSKKYGGTFSRAGFRRTIPSPTVRFGSPRIVHENLMMATSLSYLTILITITHARRTAHCVPPRALRLYSVSLLYPSPRAPTTLSASADARACAWDREIIPREASIARRDA